MESEKEYKEQAEKEQADLREFRDQIDRIDGQLLELLNRRAECALSIGRFKRENDMPIHVPSREGEVIARMIQENKGPLPDSRVETIFQSIIQQIRTLEENPPSEE